MTYFPGAILGPDDFALTPQTGVSLGALTTSNTVTLNGKAGETWPMIVTGDGSPKLQINSGSWLDGDIAVDGDTVKVRLTASSSSSTERTATIYAPGFSEVFSVETTASAFSPGDLATLLRWFKADEITGSDGDAIGTFVDDSTNAKNATASGSDRGTLKTAIQNGLSVLRYSSGTNGYRAVDLGADLASDNSHSFFWVAKPTIGNYPVVMTYPYGAAWSFILEYDTSGSFYHANGGSHLLWSASHANATWHLSSAIKTGSTTAEFWKNGTQIVSSTGSIASMAATTGDMQMLGYTTNTYGFIGDFAELVVLSNADSTEARKVEGYLAWKWGLQALLPGGHPYASAAP